MARKRGPVSIVSIAGELGISPATVSRVINNRTGVSETVRRLVQQKLREYDFKVNYPAQRKQRIAIVSASAVFSHYHAEVLSGIFQYMQAHNLTPCLIIYNRQGGETLLELLRDQQCSGVILLIPADFSRELPDLASSGLPVMQVDEASSIPTVGFIDNDSYSGSLAAVRHLLSLGHRNIAYFSAGQPTLNHLQRLKAYENALSEQALSPLILSSGYHTPEERLQLLRLNLRSHPEITAVMTTNDDLAQLVLRAAADLNIRIPEELSVIGFDDYPLSASLCPSLTTVRHPSREAGARAAESIGNYLASNGRIPLQRDILPTTLILRSSTAPAKNIKNLMNSACKK